MRRITTIVGADGWRLVRALVGYQGALDWQPSTFITETDENAGCPYFQVLPIACFALVKAEDREDSDTIHAVVADDWPTYLYPGDMNDLGPSNVIVHLGPGEKVPEEAVAEAKSMIEKWRAEHPRG